MRVVVAVLLCVSVASAQDRAFAPTELDLKKWLQDTSKVLWARTAPEAKLAGTQYVGLLRDGKPVGYEVFDTAIVDRLGRRVYRMNDRAVLRTPEGRTMRIRATGLADAAFNGLEASLVFKPEGPLVNTPPARAKRAGKTVLIELADQKENKPQVIRVNEQVVALSGEMQRLMRVRKWKPGDVVALWHLDMVNGRLGPVVMRAVVPTGLDDETFARKFGPVKVETYFFGGDEQFVMEHQSTTYFDETGAVSLIRKTTGLTKLVLTEAEFKKNWEPKFAK